MAHNFAHNNQATTWIQQGHDVQMEIHTKKAWRKDPSGLPPFHVTIKNSGDTSCRSHSARIDTGWIPEAAFSALCYTAYSWAHSPYHVTPKYLKAHGTCEIAPSLRSAAHLPLPCYLTSSIMLHSSLRLPCLPPLPFHLRQFIFSGHEIYYNMSSWRTCEKG